MVHGNQRTDAGFDFGDSSDGETQRLAAVEPLWLPVAATLTLIDNVSHLATSGTTLGPLGLVAFATVNVWIIVPAIRSHRASH